IEIGLDIICFAAGITHHYKAYATLGQILRPNREDFYIIYIAYPVVTYLLQYQIIPVAITVHRIVPEGLYHSYYILIAISVATFVPQSHIAVIIHSEAVAIGSCSVIKTEKQTHIVVRTYSGLQYKVFVGIESNVFRSVICNTIWVQIAEGKSSVTRHHTIGIFHLVRKSPAISVVHKLIYKCVGILYRRIRLYIMSFTRTEGEATS